MSAPASSEAETRPSRDPGGISAIERLAEDMVARWKEGERPLPEHYLERLPHLGQSPDAVLELIAEELALREEYNEPISLEQLSSRFPEWSAQIRALLHCQRTLGRQSPRFPSPGEQIGEFHLVSQLGQGSHARVFLASQPALGNRQVVLKLGPQVGHEHVSLARLQHSHIVPLYSVHEFLAQGLRGLCLPYFGGATLAEVLTRVHAIGRVPAAQDLFDAISSKKPGEENSGSGNAAPASLQHASFPDLICLFGACLADALQYAHERGLLHLDLKPSNVLIAADGVPMLLDFHLARGPLRAGENAPPFLGGTPGYMAPEHVAALQSVRDGQVISASLDARADVYSLGIVLREALALSGSDTTISPGLNDIISRSTAADPEARYSSAAALGSDLRRHLSDLPLRGVPNRSPLERWRKWRRRRPLSLPLLLGISALASAVVGLLVHANNLMERAARAHEEGTSLLNQGRYGEAINRFATGESLVSGVPLQRELRSRLQASKRVAERGQTAVELHLACEQIRPLYAADLATLAQSQSVERRCRELWEKREELVALLTGQTSTNLDQLWRADLLDVAILTSRLRERMASPAALQQAHRDAQEILDQAERLLGANGILYLERARHARALGHYSASDRALSDAHAHPPSSAWDHLVLGRHYLEAGDLRRAMHELDSCLQLDPKSLWAHYYKGVLCLRTGKGVEAVAELSSCATLSQSLPWCLHNLGQAYADVNENELALVNFDRALQIEPTLAASYLGRASVNLKKGRYGEVRSDLRSSLAAGAPPAEVDYRMALVLLGEGNRQACLSSLRNCLAREPRHVEAQDLLNKLRDKP